MRLLLQLCLSGLGVAAIVIGLMFFFFGAQFTAEFFSAVPAFFGAGGQISGFDNPDIDGEFRFYSVFWTAYGYALVMAARSVDVWMNRIPLLAGLFFLGGVGRMLSINQFGMPHSLFQILLAVELLLPIIIMGLWFAIRPKSNM